MAIVTAVERGSFVYVYGANNQTLCTLPTGSAPGDGLKGYTGTSVSIRRGSFIYIYNERGNCIQTIPA